jgi:flagellar motor switch protein FliG
MLSDDQWWRIVRAAARLRKPVESVVEEVITRLESEATVVAVYSKEDLQAISERLQALGYSSVENYETELGEGLINANKPC